MPIYEYVCSGCDLTFEDLVLRSSDEEELVCPRCGTRKDLERLVSATAIVGGAGGGGGGGASTTRACGPVG